MVGRFHAVVVSALAGIFLSGAPCHGQGTPAQSPTPVPSPQARQSPTPSGAATPAEPSNSFPPSHRQGERREKPPFGDRPFFKKMSGDFEEVHKLFQRLSPDQRDKFMENLQRWQELTPTERMLLRYREEERRQRMLQEIDKTIRQSGLRLDEDTREMYILRYTQERRKIEEKLQREMDEKRRPLLQEMNTRLKEEFKAMSGLKPAPAASASASPSSSPAPAESPAATPEPSASPAK